MTKDILPDLSIPPPEHALVTPEGARRLLSNNRGNRNIRETVVKRYAADMAAGQWHQSTGVIVVAADGTLLDGQHRLLACVQAGVPFPTLVAWGADREAMIGIDTGTRRGTGDYLNWAGETHGNALAAACRLGWQWRPDKLATGTPTNAQVTDWLEQNPGIRSGVEAAGAKDVRVLIGPAAYAVVFYRLNQAAPDVAEVFFRQAVTGVLLQEHTAPWALRKAILDRARRPGDRAAHATRVESITLWVKAWNAFVSGRKVKQLKTSSLERFPTPLDAERRPFTW